MHIIVKIIVISIFFSSFNDVELLRTSMSADCCMAQRREWGTMAAVGGGGCHGWHVCVIYLALASFP
jgi:hypothetical protein